jgi:hypothetical protein
MSSFGTAEFGTAGENRSVPPPLLVVPRADLLDLCAGEGKESWKQNGRDRALPLLCCGRRIPAYAPAIEEVRLSGVRPPGGAGRSLYEVRLSKVPADEPAREPLPDRGRTTQKSASDRTAPLKLKAGLSGPSRPPFFSIPSLPTARTRTNEYPLVCVFLQERCGNARKRARQATDSNQSHFGLAVF